LRLVALKWEFQQSVWANFIFEEDVVYIFEHRLPKLKIRGVRDSLCI